MHVLHEDGQRRQLRLFTDRDQLATRKMTRTNFDTRSFRLNAEANLNVLDRDFARAQARIFDQDKVHCHRVTKEEWGRRPLKEKAVEHLTALLRSQL